MFKNFVETFIDWAIPEHQQRLVKQRLGLHVADTKNKNLPFNRCVQEDGFIHVYTDGSCAYQKSQLGLGIVIPDRNDKVKFTFARRVIPEQDFDFQRFGPMKAEFMAVTHALNNLPHGANVHIYTDHPILRTTLRRHIGGKRLNRLHIDPNGPDKDVLTMMNDLKEALRQKGDIQVTNLKDNQSRRMQLAHELAAKGSGTKGIKIRKIRPEKQIPSVENAFLIGDPREDIEEPFGFNDPLPIIDFKL